ncbi:hypothetical protein [Mycoplasmopsis pullorum]|uniref:DUF4375 domain-containing protein n=1 Tax=Mycoplasmopsis pullorum TaxID=48003 RepID=A0A1L4FSU7_9BACT|nr:hypothetical protein [Mycoplasmopsis pullorum]APJ38695.1 hypothetical protein BLA55_03480 [Mycoplasmopsis pullorum]
MKFTKKQALNLLEKWEQEEKVSIIRDEILKKDELFPYMESLYYYTYGFQYFWFVRDVIKEQKERKIDLGESFKEVNDNIKNIADYFSTSSDSTGYWFELNEKIEYLLDKKHLTNERIQELNLKELEEIANYHLINDFLIEFSKRFEAEFNKELELENQKEMLMEWNLP